MYGVCKDCVCTDFPTDFVASFDLYSHPTVLSCAHELTYTASPQAHGRSDVFFCMRLAVASRAALGVQVVIAVAVVQFPRNNRIRTSPVFAIVYA